MSLEPIAVRFLLASTRDCYRVEEILNLELGWVCIWPAIIFHDQEDGSMVLKIHNLIQHTCQLDSQSLIRLDVFGFHMVSSIHKRCSQVIPRRPQLWGE